MHENYENIHRKLNLNMHESNLTNSIEVHVHIFTL